MLLAPPLYPFPRSMTWLYTLFALPVFGWLYARTLALPLGLPFIGMAVASAFLPQLPPRGYIKRVAAIHERFPDAKPDIIVADPFLQRI